MTANGLKEISSNKSFQGLQKVFEFYSQELKCNTKFGIYLPESINSAEKLPALFYLSGLTCTEANFIEKSGFQKYASQYKIIVVNPDTSPRGVKIEGDDESYDFGTGAGFYLDATTSKWKENYKMYSYITKELPKVLSENFPINMERIGIFGHSMGGHGALTIGLKNPQLFRSISTFSAICNPKNCDWGKKAFTGYLGEDASTWNEYDATELAKTYNGQTREILLDQGLADQFLEQGQLKPESLTAVQNENLKITYKPREGYNHSYFYIATFIGEHFEFHAKHL